MSEGLVLIVDDEPSILKSYSRSLVSAGFEVAQASSGREALRYMAEHDCDVVVTDLRMPKMDGLALLGQMHVRSLNVPVVLMLDTPDNRVLIRAAKLGAVQSLVKPITRELLRQTAVFAVRLKRSALSPQADFVQNPGPARSITATVAKNEFGRELEKVLHGGITVITKHDTPKAVLMSFEDFRQLSNAGRNKLDALTGEFDALLGRMQIPEARSRMRDAFGASPRQLGQAAVAAARKRA
jgi:prevent-host-death family protein